MKVLNFCVIIILALAVMAGCSKKMTEEELYQTAQEQYGKEQYEEALKTFQKLADDYPQGKRHAEALFMLGFINANDVKDYEKAESFYKKFMEQYPDHDLADDAEYEIKTLGKDINELPIFQNLAADSLEDK